MIRRQATSKMRAVAFFSRFARSGKLGRLVGTRDSPAGPPGPVLIRQATGGGRDGRVEPCKARGQTNPPTDIVRRPRP